MYRPLWNQIRGAIQSERIVRDVADVFALARWSSFDKIGELARLIAAKMQDAGMCDVEVIELAADGKTFYAGWVIPEAYDVETARVELVEPEGEAGVLLDYEENPFALMLYTGGTAEGGVVADVALLESGTDVKDKVVLVRGMNPRLAAKLFDAGAVGIMDDNMGRRSFIKDGAFLDDAVQWNNYSLPPWRIPNRGFGVSLSPRQGERLRRLIDGGERVKVRADVRVRHYDGVLPVVTGRLAGESREEIVVTGHFDEPGADDNASGVAASIEAVRAIRRLLDEGAVPGLNRSVRLIFAMEVRGLQALLNTRNMHKRFLLGLNADTVGSDQNLTTCYCAVGENFPALPSFADDFVVELLRAVQRENPLFRYERARSDMIDNVLGEPLIGAPTPQLYHFTAHHHTDLDRPEHLSARALSDACSVVGTYLLFLANAGLDEALWLAELAAAEGRKALVECANAARLGAGEDATARAKLGDLLRKYESKLDSVGPLVRGWTYAPTAEGLERMKDFLIGEAKLTPWNHLLDVCGHLSEELADLAGVEAEHLPAGLAAAEPCADAAPLVPRKNFLGFLGFEDFSEAEKDKLEAQGVRVGWGAPMWLQHALFASSGKTTLAEIRADLGLDVAMEQLREVFLLLGAKGLVTFRPCLVKEDILRAIDALGVERGDTVLLHSSLSEFGYVEGGADTVLNAVIEALGEEGTLMLPTFTFSWIGAEPYERERTPSILGTIPNVFWPREGVLRSDHPTHSFAAAGRHAQHLLAGHDASMAPIAKEGPIGKLARLGGKVLMLCRRGPNTTMHAGEYWSGVPYLAVRAHVVEGGVRREVLVKDMPWHALFDDAYEILSAENRIRCAELGEGTVYLMRAEDAVAAQARVVRESPGVLVRDGCECEYCRGVRAWIESGRRG